MIRSERALHRKLRSRKAAGLAFAALCIMATAVSIGALSMLLLDITLDGSGRLGWDFLNSFPSRKPEDAGIKAALWGTIWMMGFTAAFAVPIGLGAAIYLEEYAPRNWFTRVIQVNIANLAGVPSIIYGLLGLALFVRALELNRSVLAGRVNNGAPDSPDYHHRRSGGTAGRPQFNPGRGIRAGRVAVADGLLSGCAGGPARNDDRDHPGAFPRDRRGCAVDYDWRASIRAIHAFGAT